jgi:hypothetical protein
MGAPLRGEVSKRQERDLQMARASKRSPDARGTLRDASKSAELDASPSHEELEPHEGSALALKRDQALRLVGNRPRPRR